MKEFIMVRDALTNELMIIRKSMICSVENCLRDKKSVRRINYIDCRTPEYVSDSLLDIMNELKTGVDTGI